MSSEAPPLKVPNGEGTTHFRITLDAHSLLAQFALDAPLAEYAEPCLQAEEADLHKKATHIDKAPRTSKAT